MIATAAAAQPTLPGGGVVVRVAEDPGQRCIDVRNDRISAVVRRFTTPRTKSWLREDTAVALVVGTALEGRTGGSAERVSFQRTYVTSVRSFENVDGIVSIPIEPRLFTGFPLTQNQNTYEVAEIDFRVTNITRPTTLTLVVESLAELTDSLPLPTNPFTDGFKYFANYSNDLIRRATEENPDDTAGAGQFTLQFAIDGQCTGDLETTGTKVIVYGGAGDGMVDITRINDYCFVADLTPAFVLRHAVRATDGSCPETGYSVMRNAHIAVYLNAVPRNLSRSGPEVLALARDRDQSDDPTINDAIRALDLCRSNGIAAIDCF